MNDIQTQRHINAIISIIEDYMPDDWTDNDKLRYSQMLRKNLSEDETNQVKTIVGILYDGLAYGNWP
jgi:hypothetical protein